MNPRILLFTGKGGVGKTTVAAATATFAARTGRKTLVVSTDTAHSLADALAVPPADTPTEIVSGLYLRQIDTQRAMERQWGEVRDYLRGLFVELGLDEITSEEIVVLPGAEEVIALLELREQARSGRWDVIVVDCAPTAETLRLLALPEALDWHVNRLLPVGRRLLRVVSPVVRRAAHVTVPGDDVVAAGERLHRALLEVRALLTGGDASVRLVLTPEAVVLAEARRTLTSLSLYGYRVDAVVANRVFPAAGADPWREGWVAAQARHLREIEESFAPLPVHLVPYLAREPVGVDALAEVAEAMYAQRGPAGGGHGGDAEAQADGHADVGRASAGGPPGGRDGVAASTAVDPFAPPATRPPLTVSESGELTLALPFADHESVDLARKGDELIITAGAHRRVLALPAALARSTVREAVLRDGLLRVRFESGGRDD
jgi:arsenite-transporting ATPase